ncbi:MAG: DUF3501 family protein [Gammaproteobacteria bacterium]|nr:DUF3501 family protein [Gammaproteobacteria bacterium]
MNKLALADLYSLEEYARHRAQFRAHVIAHKKHRRIHLGAHFTICFEDRLTVQYQVQEMLRIERIFEPEGIAGELAAYNPLIPDGSNWKATFLVEYPDPAERAQQLARLVGIEHRVWIQVGDLPPSYAIADEDLDRSTDAKTSAVHFLRFELTAGQVAALRAGAGLRAGIDHPACTVRFDGFPELVRESLVADLD